MTLIVEHTSDAAEPISELEYTSDEGDLARFGKKVQLKRIFGFFSTVGLTCTLIVTWETMLMVFQSGLQNGGPAGLVYGYIFVFIGTILQVLVMAEMASMVPLAGGQYNWVSVLAPPSCSKFLSYLTGWTCVIGWQVACASGAYFGGTLIQGLLVLNYPSYTPERWQGTLLYYAVLAFAAFVSTVLKPLLPLLETVFLTVHVLGFVVILVAMLVLAPHHATAKGVFTTFSNGGNWTDNGLAFFVGLTTTMFSFIGCDAASHIAEEVQHASSTIPRSMLTSVLLNGTLGFGMVIATLFCMGDVEEALDSPTGYPAMEVFTYITGSTAGGTAMSMSMVLAATIAPIATLTTCSRMTWAFARERGLPFSTQLSQVHGQTAVPLVSVGVTAAISVLLGLINVGSTVAFNAFTSLFVAAYFSTFVLSAAVLLRKRLVTAPADMAYGPFSLGPNNRCGLPVIAASLVYSLVGLFFSFWPPAVEPDAASMNWTVAVFGGSLVWSLVYWLLWGRRVYTGPVVEVSVLGEAESTPTDVKREAAVKVE